MSQAQLPSGPAAKLFALRSALPHISARLSLDHYLDARRLVIAHGLDPSLNAPDCDPAIAAATWYLESLRLIVGDLSAPEAATKLAAAEASLASAKKAKPAQGKPAPTSFTLLHFLSS